MNKARGYYWKKIVVAGSAAILMLAMAAVAYAKDVGGIQRNVQIWLYGELTDAVMVVENGEYTLRVSVGEAAPQAENADTGAAIVDESMPDGGVTDESAEALGEAVQ